MATLGKSTMSNKAYFVADAHLGANKELERRTVPALLSLFDEVKQNKGSLYILGDLFDFWFEFKHSLPKIHIQVLAKLFELKREGCPIVFVAGNHDFWMESYLGRELGATTCVDWFECEIQRKRVFLSHGDGLTSGDIGYKILKKILRSKLNIALYRLIHPDIAFPFALACSRLSRKTSVAEMKFIAETLFREVALRRFEAGCDFVLVGHVHLPYEKEHNGKRFLIVGDWIENLSYLVMEEGQIRRMIWSLADGPRAV
jgi:UDP-2,3-diacylglucosamine hydrolase